MNNETDKRRNTATDLNPIQENTPAKVSGIENAPSVRFSVFARAITDAGKRLGLNVPSFRSPPHDGDLEARGHAPDASLTPAQLATLELIRLPNEDRITHPSTLRAQIELELEKETVDLVELLDEPLWVSKRQLHAVNSCEALYEAQDS